LSKESSNSRAAKSRERANLFPIPSVTGIKAAALNFLRFENDIFNKNRGVCGSNINVGRSFVLLVVEYQKANSENGNSRHDTKEDISHLRLFFFQGRQVILRIPLLSASNNPYIFSKRVIK
jgi:hypothetical protein